MAETLNPTDEQFYEALPLVDNRLSIALNEILRRLRDNMPAKIDYINTQLGHPSGKGIKEPNGYYLAPGILTDTYINTILVGAATSTVAGSPKTFKNETQIVVYSIGRKIEVMEQVDDAFDRSGVIRGILYHFLTGCEDADGRQCWQLLEPSGLSMLPEAYANYAGVACYYRMVQADLDADNWV